MYPTIEDIRKIAAKGQYKRVPVCREVYADRYTPVEAMRTLRKQADIVICLRVPARQKYGEDILSWDMNQQWRLPVRMGL